jgi:poly(beta-D-mannuronate) lyase
MSVWPNRLKVAGLVVYAIVACLIIVVSYASLIYDTKPPKKTPKKPSASINTQPTAKPTPAPLPTSSAINPGNVINLTNWKLTLPIAAQDKDAPEEITQPQLASFMLAPYFQLNTAKNGVQFQAPVGGVTTANSSYPRSELREMTANGSKRASWSNTSGTNTMTIRQAITHVPAVKNELVAGQIHDAFEYVILVRLNGSTLFVQADGENIGSLDNNYVLGTVFDLQLIASDGHIRVLYNGVKKADYVKSGSGYYFKAGCYTQSNPAKGDDPNDFGQVVIYDLQVSHTYF